MGDNEQLQIYGKPFLVAPPSLRKEVKMQKRNLLDKIANATSKPWHIENGLICVDEVMSEDEVERLMALGIPFTTSYGTLLPTYKTEDLPSALRIKRNKKHYKPKFTL